MNKNVARILSCFSVLAVVLAWSGWQPYDRLTWWLETFPGMIGLIVLAGTYRRFRFTTLCYTFIALHICLLCAWADITPTRA